jgi:hypothetical protein
MQNKYIENFVRKKTKKQKNHFQKPVKRKRYLKKRPSKASKEQPKYTPTIESP